MNRLILRELIIYLPARVGPALIALISVPVLTRLLPQRDYGDYLLALSSLTLIGALCVSWLVSVIVRFQAVHTVSSLARACRSMLLAALFSAILVWLLAAHLQGEPWSRGPYLWAGAAWVACYALFEYYVAWLRARNLPLAYSVALCWRSAGGLLLALPFLFAGIRNGATLLFAAAGAMALSLLVLPRIAMRPADNALDRMNLSDDAHWAPLLRYGLPAALSNLWITGLSVADRFVIKAYMGPEALAAYGASYDIAERTIFFVNTMLLLSSSVVSVQIFERDGQERAAEYLSHLLRIYLLGAAIVVTVMAVLAPQIVAVLLPSSYAIGATILPLVATAGLLVGIMHRYSIVLSFHRRTDVVMWCSALALLANLVGCLLLVPHIGLVGAALSTAIGYGAWLLFIRVAARPYLVPRFPWRTLMRVVFAAALAAIAMKAVALPTLPSLLMSAVLGATIYLVALVVSREIPSRDIRIAYDLVCRRLARRR